MENFRDKKLDLTLGSIEENDGKFYFVGEALTLDYECEDGLNSLAKKTINKHFTWRHRHPIQKEHKENHVYGIVEDAWVGDKLMVKTQLYSHTEDHRKLIQDIQLRDLVNDPLSLSMHYRTYFNEEGVVKHYDVFELAGTPYPHCKQCNILSGVKKMEDEKPKIENKEEEAELEEEDLKALETIKGLETELNSKSKAYEELKSKVDKLESELEVKDNKEKTLEDRVLELEGKIDFLNTKKPILDKLLEADSEIDESQAKWLKTQTVTYIEGRLEKALKRAESQIVVQTTEETAEDAKLEKDKEEKELETVTFDKFIRDVGPIGKSRVK